MGEPVPEQRRNLLLRRVDWRFLLPGAEPPETVDLAGGELSAALGLVFPVRHDGGGDRDGDGALVVLDRPTRARLARARQAVAADGQLVCVQRWPWPGGAQRLRRRLTAAGFAEPKLVWPGPRPGGPPHFWLAIDDPATAEGLLRLRPATGRRQLLLRRAWSPLVRAGALAPLVACAVPAGGRERSPDAIDVACAGDGAEGPPPSWVLLTGGARSLNKVVALPFRDGQPGGIVVKFARVPEADPALDREAEVLRRLEAERPTLPGVPRVRAAGRRSGRTALVETALHGTALLAGLTPSTFPALAAQVSDWLVELAGETRPVAGEVWWPRLVGGPLAACERDFGRAAPPGTFAEVRRRLRGLRELPLVCEHRDCSPWNVVLTADAEPALLDWESAESVGLPMLDLVYFLAQCAFVLEGALERSRTREVYATLLDSSTPAGGLFDRTLREHALRVGVAEELLPALRLACWIVHSGSEHERLVRDAGGAPGAAALHRSVVLGLIAEELRAGGWAPAPPGTATP